MNKKTVFGSVSLVLWSIFNWVALAQARCMVNGKEVPCEQAAGVLKAFAGIGLIGAALLIAASIFWLVMLIHAITKPIENKAVWIIVIVVFGIIGAIVYYFAIKRPFNKQQKMAATSYQAPMPPQQPPTPPASA